VWIGIAACFLTATSWLAAKAMIQRYGSNAGMLPSVPMSTWRAETWISLQRGNA
jgi:hypothetical protein